MSDKSRTETGTNQEESLGYTSALDILTDCVALMDTKNYKMCPNPVGSWAGFDVYVRNPNTRAWAPLGEFCRPFMQAWRKVCMSGTGQGDKEYDKVCYSFIKDMEERAKDPKSRLRGIASSLGKVSLSTSLSGLPGHFKVVPSVASFPDNLKNYDSSKLLTLFPPAERKMMMLAIGRAVAGASGDKVEGNLDHTWRSFIVILGSEAGLGKSTLLRFLSDAVESCGYKTAQVNSDLNRFGWGQVATSDLALLDDLTEEIQKKLLTNNYVKSLASGGKLKVEEKGIAGWDTVASAVLICCSNVTSYKHLLDMDSGSISRANLLYTYTSKELVATYGTDRDYRLKEFWEDERDRLNTNLVTLGCRLLRECLDLFLEVSGHYYDSEGYISYARDRNKLKETVEELRSQYRVKPELAHKTNLVKAVAKLVGSAVHDNPKLLAKVEHLGFSPELLVFVLRLFVAKDTSGYVPDDLGHDVRRYVRAKLSELKDIANSGNIDQAFKAVINLIKSDKGYGYPGFAGAYTTEWEEAKRSLVTSPVPEGASEVLEEVMADLTNLITKL